MSRRPSTAAAFATMAVSPPARTPVLQAAHLTKWAVCAAVGGGLVALHNTPSLLVVTGALGNATCTKALKRVLNAPRPDSAAARAKDSAGMPSSHASSLAFFAAAAWLVGGGGPAAAACEVAGLVAASWRARAGLHTWPQVVVGYAWGSAAAAAWAVWAMPRLAPAVDAAVAAVGPWPLTAAVAAAGAGGVLARDLGGMRRRGGGE
jgi:hypothetical protein